MIDHPATVFHHVIDFAEGSGRQSMEGGAGPATASG